MSNYLVFKCEFVGLNLGLNFSTQCNTMCNNNNQSSFFSNELGASYCVVMSSVVGNLATARNLKQSSETTDNKGFRSFLFLRGRK